MSLKRLQEEKSLNKSTLHNLDLPPIDSLFF